MYLKSKKSTTGQELWKKAKKVIQGGNMLLSKNPDNFLPQKWPAYFNRTKGCKVWDLDDNCYVDMSLMGIGTNILGYSNDEVDLEVNKVIQKGNMSTLNCPEEVELAEKLIEIHPWADMVKFARTGGEANSIAVRIARISAKNHKIAVCGYHGWHDWYLAANINDKENLADHLMPGLPVKGIPRELKKLIFPFKYNNIDELLHIIKKEDIGIIKMEVSRSEKPKNDFLKNIRDIANKNNIILIFDECTSGFRETNGGLHKKYSVIPDIAIFGKALGNGYAITSIIGKNEIMKPAEDTFISSTFWTERIGSVAALKTLEVMEKTKSWDQITSIGKNIQKHLYQLAKKYELKINITGLPSLTNFNFAYKNNNKYKTLITQEMLKKGYLASNIIYVCTEHKQEIVSEYLYNLDNVFRMIKECEDGREIDRILNVSEARVGFARMN